MTTLTQRRQTLISATHQPEAAPATIGALADMLTLLWHNLEPSTTDHANNYITRTALAAHFGVGKTRIATAIARAKLQGITTGKTTRYPRAEAIKRLAPHLSGPLPVC